MTMAETLSNKTIQRSTTSDFLNVNSICRICLEKSNKLTQIFDPVKAPHFSILIMACAAVEVEEGDGLPPYICQKCISRLNIAFQFKTQCESSDEKMRLHLFQSNNVRPPPPYSEYQTNNSEDTICKNNKINEESLLQQDIFGGTILESSQESYKNLEVGNMVHIQVRDTDGAIKNITTEYSLQDSFMQNDPSTIKLEDLNGDTISMFKTAKKRKKPVKVHKCDTCGKVFRTKPSLVHHVRIHTGERPYICHLCPKKFINGGHLHTHMKTHTGEKNHICAACNKAFTTAQQLTKHTIAIHTSERPYACSYCPKRFASSSNLNTHIRVHTGQKDFHCEFCGKTFSTKGQLQQHLVVHTGDKPFLCEFCNKRFSQKAHLVRHIRIHNRTE